MNAERTESSAKTPRVMLVDDEEAILGSLRRLFRQDGYLIDAYDKPMEALAQITSQPYDLVISDMRMPEMDGASFLQAVAIYSPHTMRLLLTGYADQEATVRAINLGKIHGYLNKPWDNDQLREQVARTLKQKADNDRELQQAQKLRSISTSLLNSKKTLEAQLSSIRKQLSQTSQYLDCANNELKENFGATLKVLSQIVHTTLLHDDGISQLVYAQCEQLLANLDCSEDLKRPILHAAQLCQLGKLGMPERILKSPIHELYGEDRKLYQQYPARGEQWLFPVPALQTVAKIIRHHQEHYDGSGVPDGLCGTEIPLGARLLKIVLDFNLLLMGKLASGISSPQAAADYMRQHAGTVYDPELLEVFRDLPNMLSQYDALCGVHECDTEHLLPGMMLCCDLISPDRQLLLIKDSVLTQSMINRLRLWEVQHNARLSLAVKRTDIEQP